MLDGALSAPASTASGATVHQALTDINALVGAGGIPATIVDVKGDLIAATAADTVARLAAGADGLFLKADSAQTTGLVWAAPGGTSTWLGCKLTRAAAQSVLNGTLTEIDFDTEVYDTDTMHFTSAANLTGTVAKAAASATLTGTGTAFTTELAVGQIISVPGTAAERPGSLRSRPPAVPM